MLEILIPKNELDIISVIARSVEIRFIKLIGTSFRSKMLHEEEIPDQSKLSFNISWNSGLESFKGDILNAIVSIEVKTGRKQKNKKSTSADNATNDDVSSIKVDFLVSYKTPSDPPPQEILDADGFELFAKYNALYNCWPYARAEIERICTFARLPVAHLPLFGYRHKPEQNEVRPLSKADTPRKRKSI